MKYLKQTYISCALKFPTRREVEKHAAGSYILFVQKRDREDISDWCPISLLNSDNKIYSKILTNKIQPTLEDIIGLEQTAAIKIEISAPESGSNVLCKR